jgi:hypothetical protein
MFDLKTFFYGCTHFFDRLHGIYSSNTNLGLSDKEKKHFIYKTNKLELGQLIKINRTNSNPVSKLLKVWCLVIKT